MNAELIDRFREGMIAACGKAPGSYKTCVLLSGGLDSGSILAGMLHAGKKFGVATINFGGADVPSLDVQAAQLRWQALCATRRPKIPLHRICIERDEDKAIAATRWCIDTAEAALKTAIEVMVVMYHALPMIRDLGYTCVLNGMTGGILWGVGRELEIGKIKRPCDANSPLSKKVLMLLEILRSRPRGSSAA